MILNFDNKFRYTQWFHFDAAVIQGAISCIIHEYESIDFATRKHNGMKSTRTLSGVTREFPFVDTIQSSEIAEWIHFVNRNYSALSDKLENITEEFRKLLCIMSVSNFPAKMSDQLVTIDTLLGMTALSLSALK